MSEFEPSAANPAAAGGPVVVVGGGAIGLSIAWRTASAGRQTVVVDPAPGSGASGVAAGMLAPVTEAWPGEEALLRLGIASLERWPSYAGRLVKAAGRPAGLRTDGSIVVAADPADRAELDRLADYLGELGRPVTRLTASALREREPALGRSVRGGLDVPGEHSVDNRALIAALTTACERAGVRFVAATAVSVRTGSVTVTSVNAAESGQGLVGGEREIGCGVAVIAAGAWSGRLHERLRTTIRSVKGEVLRLRGRSGSAPLPGRTVRAVVGGRPCYLVPRDDGSLVVGATQYEAGFDLDVTVGGVRDLIADAERVLPQLAECALVESAAGLRPGSPDNRPLIGWLDDGVLAATGHHRNGLLLAPLTVDLISHLLNLSDSASHDTASEDLEDALAATDPARFDRQLTGGRRA